MYVILIFFSYIYIVNFWRIYVWPHWSRSTMYVAFLKKTCVQSCNYWIIALLQPRSIFHNIYCHMFMLEYHYHHKFIIFSHNNKGSNISCLLVTTIAFRSIKFDPPSCSLVHTCYFLFVSRDCSRLLSFILINKKLETVEVGAFCGL